MRDLRARAALTSISLTAALLFAAGCSCGSSSSGGCKRHADCREGRCDDGRCAACPWGGEGCPCQGGACDAPLACDGATGLCRAALDCASAGCAPHQRCEEGSAGKDATCLPSCEPGFLWNAASRACDADPTFTCDTHVVGSIGAACQAQKRVCVTKATGPECGACISLYVEIGGACVEPPKCADPNSVATTCAERNELCEDLDGKGTCTTCLPDHHRTAASAPCALPRACSECDSLNRRCQPFPDEEGVDPSKGTCSSCLEGYVAKERAELCLAPRTCPKTSPPREGDLLCAATEVCVEELGKDAACVARPDCPDGSAFRVEGLGGSCVTCMGSCSQTGQTGRWWPFTRTKVSVSNPCVCETELGYFVDGDQNTAPCDEDGDGWLRGDAFALTQDPDPALRSNARCIVRLVSSVTLKNEYNQERTIYVCRDDRGALSQTTSASCNEKGLPQSLPMVEPIKLDSDATLADGVGSSHVDIPRYGAAGRKPFAAELNPLTKGCVSELGDYNANDEPDIDEDQRPNPDDLWRPFTYFLELYRLSFQAYSSQSPDLGKLVISERKRCLPQGSSPLLFVPTTALTYPATEDVYWKSCARAQEPGYDGSDLEKSQLGMDFARWTCPNTVKRVGSVFEPACVASPPPVIARTSGGVPPHGLCDSAEGSLPPLDGIWRGMHHASQFKCVRVWDQAPPAGEGGEKYKWMKSDALWGTEGALAEKHAAFNSCAIDGTGEESSERPNALLASTVEFAAPKLTCTAKAQTSAKAIQPGAIGFVALRYGATRALAPLGCIDEGKDANYKALCPGYEALPQATPAMGDKDVFGKLICGCAPLMGGENCELGCMESDHLSSEPFDQFPREALWMCGSAVTADPMTTRERTFVYPAPPIFKLRGQIMPTGFKGASPKSCDASGMVCVRPAVE